MHTLNRLFLRFVALFACVWVASLTTGCGASYEIKPTASSLPSRAQVEAEAARLAVPADLLTKLNAVLAESGKTAENERPDPRYIAQSAGRFANVEQKLVFALLQWGVDKYVESKQPAKAPEPAPVVAAKPLTREDPRVQVALGAVGGAALGAVPLGSVGADVAIELHMLPNGTYWGRVGRVCGEMAVGLGQIAVACTGVGAGVTMSGTGGGAAVGLPLIAESLVIGYNGLLTTANAFRHAQQLAQEGPRSAPDVATPEMLRPPRKPTTPAPVAAAPAPKLTAPTKTTTKTLHKGPNGEIIKTVTKTGDNVTTSRPKKAPAQSTEAIKPNVSEAPKAKEPHGNRVDDRPATRYEKVDRDGNLQKHGVTKHDDPNKRYTKKQLGTDRAIFKERGPRKEMIKKERELVETNPGPENREPWAGKRKAPQTGGKDE